MTAFRPGAWGNDPTDPMTAARFIFRYSNHDAVAQVAELLSALRDLDCSDILGVAESCASGMPRWEFVHRRIERAR
ncbi:MAG TPA: hypothetical protein VGQ34_11570, partial [Sphingomicrobium sp.]|nr:hypothetical protein [Sphingomicrobium sp.]